MTGDHPTQASQEPLASCDAAFSCLLQLGGRSGSSEVGALRCRNVVDGETLSISRLIELAADLGLAAEHAQLDWPRLQELGFAHPLLVLLKDTNVIVVTGDGRGEASEVAVWDPLDPFEETLFVPREDLERAWTGHALIINAPASNGAGTASPSDFCWFTSAGIELLGKTSAKGNANGGRPLNPGDRAQPSTPASSNRTAERKLSPLTRSCIAAGVIITAAGGGTLLLRDSASGPIAAALALANEVWAVAPNTARPTDQATPKETIRSSKRVAKTGSAPIPAAPLALPGAEPDVAASSAASAGEPGSAAPSAEPAATRVAPAAPPVEPAVAVPSAEPGREAPTTAPNAKTAAPPAPASGSRLPAEEMAALLGRGDTLLSAGDVASARLFYERAVDAGGGLAAIRLGETFDPLFLARVHLSGVRGDPGAALFWYRRARDLGATDAEVLLRALEGHRE